jgi:hypothetical protein
MPAPTPPARLWYQSRRGTYAKASAAGIEEFLSSRW